MHNKNREAISYSLPVIDMLLRNPIFLLRKIDICMLRIHSICCLKATSPIEIPSCAAAHIACAAHIESAAYIENPTRDLYR